MNPPVLVDTNILLHGSMPERGTDGPSSPEIEVNRPQRSFSSRAAHYSLIASAICWVFLAALVGFSGYLPGGGVVFAGLLIKCISLISLTSFLAGIAGLFAKKTVDIIMGLLGLMLSAPLAVFGYVAALMFSGHMC